MEDPGLLLSTVATASAALVAIVGGLLVSRVVSLATERSGLLHRRDDLRSQLEGALARGAQLEQRRLEWDADEVLWPYYEELADPRAEVPPLEVMIRAQEVDRPVAEIQPFLEQTVTDMAEAREMLSRLFEEGRPDASFDEWVTAGLPVPAGKRRIYETVYEQLLEEHPKPPTRHGFDISMLTDPPRMNVGDLPTVISTQDMNLSRDLDEARHQVATLKAQVEQADLALARVSSPKGVTGGAWVLGYFGTVGTLYPLGIMVAMSDVPQWTLWTVVALFASGLGLLLGYVIWQVQHLSEGG